MDLGFIHVEQSFELVFQGVTYQLSLASVRDVQGIPGVSTSPFSAKSIFAVSRGSVISIIGKSRGANVPNDIIAAKRTENSDGPLTHSTKKAQDSGAAYDAIGGLDKQIEDIRALVEMPLTKPEIFKQYGKQTPLLCTLASIVHPLYGCMADFCRSPANQVSNRQKEFYSSVHRARARPRLRAQ